jgi:hypothetical protein
MNDVTVIGFVDEESEVEFVRQISDATLNSLLSMRSTPEKPVAAPVVKICRLKSPRQQFGPQSQSYSAIYCLNNEAVEMCRDLDIALRVIGAWNEMPEEVSYDLEAHYLTKAERQ